MMLQIYDEDFVMTQIIMIQGDVSGIRNIIRMLLNNVPCAI